MVKTTTKIILLACCILLSACGNQGNGQNHSVPAESGNPIKSDTKTAEPVTPQEQEAPPAAADKESSGTAGGTKVPGTADEQASEQPAADEKPELKYHMNKVYRIVPNDESVPSKVVLLTFDDGPKDADMINRLIDTLDKHQAKAIFFVNGYRVKANPELLSIIHDRGQIIGNHAWDHIDLKQESQAKVRQQIEDVQQIVKDTVGTEPAFFRPPFGSGGDAVKDIASENDLLYMTWSNGSLDWESKNKNKPEAVINNVLEQLHPGSNILMHELPWTVEALDDLLTKLEAKGYGFVDPRAIEPQIR